MTVCLTGDVHHMSLETRDQEYMDRTEVEAAIEYAEIAVEYDVPVTLFVTGKAAEEEPARVKRLAAMENVEIGGHNYWAFDTLVHKGWRGVTGSWNGPRPFQRWEIRKTIETFAELGIEIRLWRDHAYRHDRHTVNLLSRCGMTHFSDAVEPAGDVRLDSNLIIVPINTPPDHEHVYHAFRTHNSSEVRDFDGPFGGRSCEVSDWVDWVLSHVAGHRDENHIATMLAHPACMKLADEFEAYERMCKRVATELEAVKMSEIEA